MTLTFRPATPAEIEEVWRVIVTAFTPYVRALGRAWPPTEDSPGYAEEWARGAAEVARGDVYVALENGRIVGAVRTRPREDSLYIHQLAVDPPGEQPLGFAGHAVRSSRCSPALGGTVRRRRSRQPAGRKPGSVPPPWMSSKRWRPPGRSAT